MARRLYKTAADYLVIAVTPALIMTLVSSLVFFLLLVFYRGEFHHRLQYVLFLFVFAAVLIARIAMEEGRERAMAFSVALAIAVAIVITRFSDLPMLINFGLLGLIWWSADRLTWDCTLIDEHENATGEGLLHTVGLDEPFSGPNGKQFEADVEPLGVISREHALEQKTWWRKLWERFHKARAPGVWVVYFSLAALPIFGFGQKFISGEEARQSAFRYLIIYVASALGLLLATCFLGLRRYLRQRGVEMPDKMAVVWVSTGCVLIAGLLLVCTILPRRNPVLDIAASAPPVQFGSPTDLKSTWLSWGDEGVEDDAHPPTAPGDSQKSSDESGERKSENDSGADQGGEKQQGQGQSANQNQSGQSPSGQKQSGQIHAYQNQSGQSQSGQSQTGQKQSGQNPSGQSQSGQNQSGQSQSQGQGDSKSGDQQGQSSGERQQSGQSGQSSDRNQSQGNQPQQTGARQDDRASQSGKADQSGQQGQEKKDGQGGQGESSNQAPSRRPDESQDSERSQERKRPGEEAAAKRQDQPTEQAQSPQSQPRPQQRPPQQRPAQQPPANRPPPRQPFRPGEWLSSIMGWFGVLLKFAFYAVVVIVGIWLFRKYKDELLAGFRELFKDLRDFWERLLGRKKPEPVAVAAPQEKGPTYKPFADYPDPFAGGAAGRYTPEQLVKYSFEAFEAWARERGCPRHPDQTPHEFALAIGAKNAAVSRPARALAELYSRLAYAPGPLPASSVEHVKELWKALQS